MVCLVLVLLSRQATERTELEEVGFSWLFQGKEACKGTMRHAKKLGRPFWTMFPSFCLVIKAITDVFVTEMGEAPWLVFEQTVQGLINIGPPDI